MSLQGKKSQELFKRAKAVIPYGVNSNFRYWGEEDTLVIKKGEGAYIWDADGKRFIDYRLAFGPIILGHAYPAVVDRVSKEIRNGTLFALTQPLEIELAEKIVSMTAVDKVRLTNTGTEATMHALRIARAHTKREKVIKFEGQYHGMHDYVLFSTASTSLEQLGPRNRPLNSPTSTGIPGRITDYLINLPYNDPDQLEETVTREWENVAAIIVEPTMGNAAGILPQDGWLQKIRELCDKYGIVMIMDEVKTGFRIANGGAQEYFNVRADLVTYAKAMGNGFPIAAIGGTNKVMDTIKPGVVAHGGTYSGNVVGTAAALATLEILENEPVIEHINACGTRLSKGIDEILTRHGVPHAMTGVPSMFGYILGRSEVPHDFRAYCEGDDYMYEELSMSMIYKGVFPETDGREPWFLCYSLTEADVLETLNVFEDALKEVKK